MSKVRPGERRRARHGIFRAALIALGASVAGFPLVAHTQQAGTQQTDPQQTGALRGEVAEADINSDLFGTVPIDQRQTLLSDAGAGKKKQQDDGIPTPQYDPTSQGALPDEEPGQKPSANATPKSLFEEDKPDSAFGTDTLAPSTGRPKSALQRDKDRKKRLEPPESATDRLDDERKKRMKAAEANQDPDTTGTVRTPTVDSQEEPDKAEPDSEREEAVEGLDKKAEDNPYAPVGIRLGTFNVITTLESGLTWTDNASSSPGGGDALLSESTLRLNALSEDGGDLTSLDGSVNFRKSISGEEVDETRATLDAVAERDLGGDWRALASLGYEVGPESATSPDAIEGVLDQPIKHTFDGSLGIQKDIGKLQLRLTGAVAREIYGDAELSTGGTVSQSDRDNTLGTLVLRTGYEISPLLTPFVELEYGRRVYDEEEDANGFKRSSNRYGARGGLAFDNGEKFRGELSAGWINEELEDERLQAVSGPTLAAMIAWSPWRGTTVNLDASTIVEGATGADESGSILHSGRIAVSREIRDNLTADAGFGVGYRDYYGLDGHDTILNADAGLTWWLNRYVGLSGRVKHEQLKSSLEGRDYTANSVFLGLKLQR